jgi:MFS family permease
LRPWIVGGYGVAGFARPLIGLAGSWLGVMACRMADRFGKGLRTAPRDAMLGLSVPTSQRGLAFGLHRALDNAGAVAGPLAAAGLLALGLPLRHVFLYAAIPAVVVIWLALKVREPESAAPAAHAPLRWNPRRLPPALRRYLLALALFTLGNSSNMFLLLRAEQLGTDASHVALMWAVFSGVAALASTPLSSLSDRFGRVRVLSLAWSAYAVTYAAIGFMQGSDGALWLTFAGYGLVTAAMEGTEKALVADLAPEGGAGSAFGWYHLVVGLCLLPASMLFGVLWQSFAPWLAFAFGAACALGAVIVLIGWVCPCIRQEGFAPSRMLPR